VLEVVLETKVLEVELDDEAAAFGSTSSCFSSFTSKLVVLEVVLDDEAAAFGSTSSCFSSFTSKLVVLEVVLDDEVTTFGSTFLCFSSLTSDTTVLEVLPDFTSGSSASSDASLPGRHAESQSERLQSQWQMPGNSAQRC